MGSIISYNLLNLQDDPPSRPKMTRILRYFPQTLNAKQAIKKGFKFSHKVSFESRDFLSRLSPPEIRRLSILLKRLEHLSRLEIPLDLLPLRDKALFRLFESLRHIKSSSKIHFYFTHSFVSYSKDLLLILQKTLRSLSALSRIKIKLSFPFSYCSKDKIEHQLLKSFALQKCFTSANLVFKFNSKRSAIQELIATLSSSKSLSKLSLTLQGTDFISEKQARVPHDVLHSLKKMKTVKNCRVYFKDCVINESSLNRITPAIKEAAQVFNLEIIFKRIGYFELFSWSEWWLFRRSLKSLSSFHTVHAKFIGKLELFSAMDLIILIFIGFLSILIPLAIIRFML